MNNQERTEKPGLSNNDSRQALNEELGYAYEKADNYLLLYNKGQMTLEQLRYRLVKLAKDTSKSADVYQDACSLIHELLDTYHNDPGKYLGTVTRPMESYDSIALLFAPEEVFSEVPRGINNNGLAHN